jgi:hypothetical protein
MANTLTNLIPSMYAALDVVSRELIGFIPAVTRNSSAEQAAKDQTITYPVAPASTAGDVTPGLYAADEGDQTVGTGTMTISKSRKVPIRWNGEEQRGGINAGWYDQLLQQQFAQAFRTLANEMETDLGMLYKKASRAYGTAGTAPFGTANDLSDIAQAKKILQDNGAPMGQLRCVLGTTAAASIGGKQAVLFKVNESGTTDLLRDGIIGRLEGIGVGVSAKVQAVTKGTGASYVTSGSTAPGVTDIALVTGTGTVLAGDVVTFAADTVNKYVVAVGVAAPGTISLAKPGALVTIATANAMTIGNNFTANMVFAKEAIHLVTRAPAMPIGPDGRPMDMADDVVYVTDPVSGLVFQVAAYRQYRQIKYEVAIAWGVAAVKSEHIAILLG